MDCKQHEAHLDEYLDGELDSSLAADLRSHEQTCANCDAAFRDKTQLRANLASLPVEPPQSGFFEQVFDQVEAATQKNERVFWATAGIGVGIAASVIAVLVLMLPIQNSSIVGEETLAGVTITLNVEKRVRISFESTNELQGAMLSLRLPPGVEVAGHENRSEIRWATNIEQGTNILELPIIVRHGRGGTLHAELEHEGKAKSFQLDVKVIDG